MKYFEFCQEKLKELKNKKDIIILAVESSCDETAISIVKNGREVLSSSVATQIEIHKRFGGVVPEVASRNHVNCINNVLEDALQKASLTLNDIDAIAVTYGAGLMGALLVGVNFSKSLAFALQKPLIAVNHIWGHIAANYIEHKDLQPPFICLVVSGGHTAILNCTNYTTFEKIGSTIDDAVGECFDKVARVLGLGYPGGPKIDKLAKDGTPTIKFLESDALKNTYNISYSGLKTSVINYLHKKEQNSEEINIPNICASFESEAFTPLINKVIKATNCSGLKNIVVAGGVSANSYLRENLQKECTKNNFNLYFPTISLCTDNAAMVGAQAYYNLINNVGLSDLDLSAQPSLKL